MSFYSDVIQAKRSFYSDILWFNAPPQVNITSKYMQHILGNLLLKMASFENSRESPPFAQTFREQIHPRAVPEEGAFVYVCMRARVRARVRVYVCA
jgi:hypothetical protein